MNDVALTCTKALTVIADGSDGSTPDELRRAQVHAATCPRCLRSLDDPDAADRVLSALRPSVLDPPRVFRVAIALVATIQLVFAIPWLFGATLLPDHSVTTAHLTRDGALGLVIAAAGLLAAWRPRYAVSAIVLGSIVLAAQAVAGVIDQQNQSVNVLFELLHLLVLVILAMIAISVATTRQSTPDARPTARGLRSL